MASVILNGKSTDSVLKIHLTEDERKEYERVLKMGISSCNEQYRDAVKAGEYDTADYIIKCQRRSLIKQLSNVQRGFILIP